MGITRASGFPASAQGTTATSLSITTANVGDVIFVPASINNTSAQTPSISDSSSRVTWDASPLLAPAVGVAGYTSLLWRGIVTSVGSTTITVTWTHTTGSSYSEIYADELTGGSNFTTVASNSGASASASSITMPSVTSNTAAHQFYWGSLGLTPNALSATDGTPAGFAYVFDSVTSNPFALADGLAASTAYAGQVTQSPAGNYVAGASIQSYTVAASPTPPPLRRSMVPVMRSAVYHHERRRSGLWAPRRELTVPRLLVA